MEYRFEDLTTTELALLPRDRTVVFIPVSPLEEHGPHLPYGVDAFMAQWFAEQMAKRLAIKRKDWDFLFLPTLFVGTHVLRFPGSFNISQRLVRDLVYAHAAKLARDGFKNIIVVGGHGGPRHMVALEEVAAKISWRFRGTRMVSATGGMITDVLWGRMTGKFAAKMKERGSPLSEEDLTALKTDYHAGMLETSLMMVARPGAVKAGYKDLKPAIIDKPWKIMPGSALRVGGGFGHLGSPHLARRELGEAMAEVLMNELEPKLDRFLEGDPKVGRELRSMFYLVPIFRSHFPALAMAMAAFIVFFAGMAYFMRQMASMVQTIR